MEMEMEMVPPDKFEKPLMEIGSMHIEGTIVNEI